MEVFPGDIQWFIWKTFFSKFILKKIEETACIWLNPSNHLVELCKDVGTIQQGHMEIQDMIEDHNMVHWCECVNNRCSNCEQYGFPCTNLAMFGFGNRKLDCLWKPNFV